MAQGQEGRVKPHPRRSREERVAALLAARDSVPLTFRPSELPIQAQREAIMEAISRHQVLLVAGETSSGKSTRLPQFCLELGLGRSGLIAHTQPRRIAARALAARIAEELSQTPGTSVGFKVRFADQVSDATRLLLMTDGLLLSELASDPELRRYDAIIVDEAHERSLNVDLLLGVLRKLLPRRPDLKVIVTSATLDVERIAEFFDGAPVIRVSGRSYPIEVRYQASGTETDDPDLPAAVLEACEAITAEAGEIGRGDVLVFLPGEREIRDVSEVLERQLPARFEVLPLYSRLSWDQQQKIFQPSSRQRVVLATNVAETSITVPGIRSVVDSGLARISRYSARNRLQRLPIEAVSQASAEQRKGRCGRVGPGLCLRLYAEADFEARSAFTEPEILRTNLAALLLRLAADGLGEAENFPFIDAPDGRALNDGYRLLQELEALDEERRITRTGRSMSRLPVDPRLGRAVLESRRFRAESEVLAIVAGLSVPDVRIIGRGASDAFDDPALPFEDPRSEFMSLVRLWRAYIKARAGPRRELRHWCKERRFSLLRFSEWEDVHTQLSERAREVGVASKGWNGSYTGVHRALLAGFCTLIGSRNEQGAYQGTRGVQFHLLPGSTLAKRRPRWVMAANIVETSRVFARRVAQVEPQWIESAAAHLLKREYLEPDWDEAREEVVARERISFLGLTLSANRHVNFGPIAPEESRRIFAREALVYRRMGRRPAWLLANDSAIDAAQRMEDRLRRRDLLQSAESLVDFYDSRLPRQVSSAATLEYFGRHMDEAQASGLSFSGEDIFLRPPDTEALRAFPEQTRLAQLAVAVDYAFAPGEVRDGVTLRVPLLLLPQLSEGQVLKTVPGLAAPRVEALLRALPKDARRQLIPIAETARAYLAEPGAAAGLVELATWLKEARGLPPGQILLDASELPRHLVPQLSVIGVQGEEVARGDDVAKLRRHCAAMARAALQQAAARAFPEAAWRRFERDELPRSVHVPVAGGEVELYPSLRLQGLQLLLQLEWTPEEAEFRWRDSAPRLARLMLSSQARDLARDVETDRSLMLAASPYFDGRELIDTLLQLAFRRACFADAPAPRTRAEFEAAVEQGRSVLHAVLQATTALLRGWLTEATGVRQALEFPALHAHGAAAAETRNHLKQLLSAEGIQTSDTDWLRQWSRYLKAERRRWQRLAARGSELAGVLQEIERWKSALQRLETRLGEELRFTAALQELRLWVEEYRVSLYAQELKTLGPVSAARLEQRAADIEAWLRR